MATLNSILKQRILIITALVLFINVGVKAQQKQKAILGNGFEYFSSGNGHGGFYSLNINVTKGMRTFGVAPVIHKRSFGLSGAKLTYAYNLTGSPADAWGFSGPPEILQFNVCSYLQMNRDTPLSYSTVKYESMITPDETIKWSDVKYTTFELGGGIEVQINLNRTVSIKNKIAAAVHYHTNYIESMDHERIAPSLHLSTGLFINIF